MCVCVCVHIYIYIYIYLGGGFKLPKKRNNLAVFDLQKMIDLMLQREINSGYVSAFMCV